MARHCGRPRCLGARFTAARFIVLASDIVAIVGLRALHCLLAAVATRFHLLSGGLALMLVFSA